jgi:hypothetical protein
MSTKTEEIPRQFLPEYLHAKDGHDRRGGGRAGKRDLVSAAHSRETALRSATRTCRQKDANLKDRHDDSPIPAGRGQCLYCLLPARCNRDSLRLRPRRLRGLPTLGSGRAEPASGHRGLLHG